MRNLLVLFLLFSGVLLTSCSEMGDAPDQEGIELENQDQDKESEQSETEDEESPDKNVNEMWKPYHNERFDFCVDYPTNFLYEKGESENHDGNIFATANQSSEMRASGIKNVLEESIEEAFNSATENGTYYNDEQIITYKKQVNDWFVISGKYYESIFYVRTVLKNDTFYTLYFEYHSSEEEKFKEIIERTTKAFPDC